MLTKKLSDNLNHIDQIFSQSLENARIEPPAGVWESVSSGLSTATASKTSTIWFKSFWLWSGASALAIATGTYLYLSSNQIQQATTERDAQKQQTAIVENQKAGQGVKPVEANPFREGDGVLRKSGNAVQDSTSVKKMSPSGEIPSGEKSAFSSTKTTPPVFQEHGVLKSEASAETGVPASPNKSAVQCLHSLNITAESLGQKKWKFTADGGTRESLLWSIDNNASFKAGSQMEYDFEGKEGIHFVHVKGKNQQGCDDTARTVVMVKSESTELNIFIPDYLTPNADGYNDDLKVSIGPVGEYNFVVFDKNNRQVFMSSSPEISWNGKVGLIDCDAGQYRVVLSYKRIGSSDWKTIRKVVRLERDKE